jgi:phosphate transport system permease protein
MKAADIDAIRAIITRAKRWDLFFSLLGILSLMVGVLTFTVLFVDMAIQGVPRLNLDFFTSFPSRKAANAGILSAWVGTTIWSCW